MGLQTEIWANEIAELLVPDNSFMNMAISDDAWVNNRTVHLPQSGALPNVERNRSTFPATETNRNDTEATYDLDWFTSTPTVVRDIEEVETSYLKRQSVVKGHGTALSLQMANWMAAKWAPTTSDSMIRTDGDNVEAAVTGATGQRKGLTIENIIAAKALLDDQDVPEYGRSILLPSYMYNNLLSAQWKELVSLDATGRARIEDGKLMALFGLKIYLRGKRNILSYSNAATPVLRTPSSAALTSANAAALVWQKDFVRRARGAVKVYQKNQDPNHYGDIISAGVRAGGRKAYSDGTGVVAIIESAGA